MGIVLVVEGRKKQDKGVKRLALIKRVQENLSKGLYDGDQLPAIEVATRRMQKSLGF